MMILILIIKNTQISYHYLSVFCFRQIYPSILCTSQYFHTLEESSIKSARLQRRSRITLVSINTFNCSQFILFAYPNFFPIIQVYDEEQLKKVLDIYDSTEFSKDDLFLRSHTVNKILTNQLEKIGYRKVNKRQFFSGWTVFESDVFNPVYGFGGYHIKKHTISKHHYSFSWTDDVYKIQQNIILYLAPVVGRRLSQIIGRIIGELRCNGISGIYAIFKIITKRVNNR